MNDFKQAIADLTVAVKVFTRTERFKVAETTTNSFKEFKKEVARDGCITVSLEGNEGTIYGDSLINVLARVWHDKVHLENNLDFSLDSEIKVAKIQASNVLNYLTPICGTIRAMNASRLIMLDIVAQGEYYQNTGCFLLNQKAYIKHKWYNRRYYARD